MLKSIWSGLIGAATLTLAHQALKKVRPDAPQMDVVGMRGLRKVLDAAGMEHMTQDKLFKSALVGDLIANTVYYSQVGSKPGFMTWLKGLSLGLAAGAGAVSLTPKLGLGEEEVQKSMATVMMTVGLYTLGGLAAAATVNMLPGGKD